MGVTTITREQLSQSQAIRTVRRIGLTVDLTPASAGNGANLFNVINGPVLVYRIIGLITTVIGAGAAVPRLQFLSGATLTGLCAAAASIATLGVGTLFTWTGLLAGLLTPNVGLGHLDLTAAEAGFASPITLGTGSIRLTNAVSAVSGIIDWYIAYMPLRSDGVVTPG